MKKLNLTKTGFCILALALQSLGMTSTLALANQKTQEIIRGGSGGHDVPTPFQVGRTKFELADGEVYSLLGTLVIAPSYGSDVEKLRPYFSLNLMNHPWLANAHRVESPLYLIEGPTKKWEKWEGKAINLLCQARGRILIGSKGPEYVIELRPLGIQEFSMSCPDVLSWVEGEIF